MKANIATTRPSHYESCPAIRCERTSAHCFNDNIIQEVPLNVYANNTLIRSLTCSPWDIYELTIGLLVSSELIKSIADVTSFDYIENSHEVRVAYSSAKYMHTNTSQILDTPIDGVSIMNGMHVLESNSRLFHCTGGVHSAVLMDKNGIISWFEDIGRHNALDKLIGWATIHHITMSDKVILFSGRVPYEIISRVKTCGCHCIISPGAPTSLSIQEAITNNISLIGFARDDHFNIYSHPEHIKLPCVEKLDTPPQVTKAS